MELNKYMDAGIEALASNVTKYYMKNSKGRMFMARFVPALKRAANKRKFHETEGLHVPPFLIASIESKCNLHCAGCYARGDGMCDDVTTPLATDQWSDMFNEAAGLGVSFTLIAGGEPLLNRPVIEACAAIKNMAFPVFTNGLLFDEEYYRLFDMNKNLIPVISIEGSAEMTDARRGPGVGKRIEQVIGQLAKRRILYAVSVTVTHENMKAVTDSGFVRGLYEGGCGLVFYIEYVPVQKNTDDLVLTAEDSAWLQDRVAELKAARGDMGILSFPGDEQEMEGCLAAGRGFFHINPQGGAEPCPFSPYYKVNVAESGVEAALRSDFFEKVRNISCDGQPHYGGCKLYMHEDEVMSL